MLSFATILVLAGCLTVIVLIAGCSFWIKRFSAPYLYDHLSDIPHQDTVLVLGAARLTRRGGLNRYYHNRINAVENLYKKGGANNILVSGGKGSQGLRSEAAEMKASLMLRGIPSEKIITDDKGARTWTSVRRCREVHGYRIVTIISQKFHNERAVFIARKTGLQALGLNAKPVSGPVAYRIALRESLARVKCVGEWIFWYIRYSKTRPEGNRA